MNAAYCLQCDYSLAGVPSPCPECGRAFDPANPKTFSPKPNSRTRRWVRRIRLAILTIIVFQVIVPRQVTSLTFAWPNPDGQTITYHTRWCLLRPMWLPLRYPTWSTERTAPTPVSQIPVLAQKNWRVNLLSISSDGGFIIGVPNAPGFVGAVILDTTSPPSPNATTILVTRENMDTLCKHLVLERDLNKQVSFTVSRQPIPGSGS